MFSEVLYVAYVVRSKPVPDKESYYFCYWSCGLPQIHQDIQIAMKFAHEQMALDIADMLNDMRKTTNFMESPLFEVFELSANDYYINF